MDMYKNEIKSSYDNSTEFREGRGLQSWKLEELDRFIKIMQLEKKHKVLDAGAGVGKQGEYLSQHGLEVTCMDISTSMVNACRDKGLKAFEMDYYNMEFPEGAFDAVWSMNSLLHIPKADLPLVLENIKRVLKPDGLIYIGVYGGYDFEGRWQGDNYEPKRFFSFFTDEGLREAVGRFFEIIDFKTIAMEGNGSLKYQALLLKSTAKQLEGL